MTQNLNIFIFSHFHSGSHKQHAQQYQRYSRHNVEIFPLKGDGNSFWKSKLLFGTFMDHTIVNKLINLDHLESISPVATLSDEEAVIDPFQLIVHDKNIQSIVIATSMSNLAAIRNRMNQLYPFSNVKYVYYMHESQWLYPKKPALGFDDKGPYRRDIHQSKLFTQVQYESMMAADAICWNSNYHYRTFLDRFQKEYLRSFRMHSQVEENIMKQIEARSQVLYVGLELINRFGDDTSIRYLHQRSMKTRSKPIILWNMRWEYDKNPIQFIQVLKYIKFDAKIAFNLIICGGHSFQSKEVEKKWFYDQLEPFQEDIIHIGFADSKLYTKLLVESDIVVSTSIHEFFGIAILEAVYCHTFCILPNDLSYPELIPKSFHEHCLYDSFALPEEELTKSSQFSRNPTFKTQSQKLTTKQNPTTDSTQYCDQTKSTYAPIQNSSLHETQVQAHNQTQAQPVKQSEIVACTDIPNTIDQQLQKRKLPSNNQRKRRKNLTYMHVLLQNALQQWRQLPYDELKHEANLQNFDWNHLGSTYDQFFQRLAQIKLGIKRR